MPDLPWGRAPVVVQLLRVSRGGTHFDLCRHLGRTATGGERSGGSRTCGDAVPERNLGEPSCLPCIAGRGDGRKRPRGRSRACGTGKEDSRTTPAGSRVAATGQYRWSDRRLEPADLSHLGAGTAGSEAACGGGDA